MQLILWPVVMFVLLCLIGCDEDSKDDESNLDTILPSSFKVDIPDALSNNVQLKSASSDTLQGSDVYRNMNGFIYVGESAAEIVSEIMAAIKKYELGSSMEITYISEDDNREKRLVVVENASYQNESWEHQLTIADVESEGNDDEGKAMQVFWNSSPVQGIAVMKPYNLDRESNANEQETMYRIDYTEVADDNYDRQMTVYIEGFPGQRSDVYHMTNMKLFAGRKGEYIDVVGTSIHPNAFIFLIDQRGFAWTFIGSSDRNEELGVAQVALPPHTLDESDKDTLMEKYSMYNVMYSQAEQIVKAWLTLEYGPLWLDKVNDKQWFKDTLNKHLDPYLADVKSPGYFNDGGYVSAGTAPSDDFLTISERFDVLSPYNPKVVNDLSIEFK